MKEQFIHRLNDSDMLAEITRELAKLDESTHATSEQVLGWAKRIEAQRAKAAVISRLSEVNEFNKTQKDDQKQNGIKLYAPVRIPTTKKCT